MLPTRKWAVSGRGKPSETKFPTVSQRFLTVSHDIGKNVALCPFSRYTSTFEGMIETSMLDGSIGNMVICVYLGLLRIGLTFF